MIKLYSCVSCNYVFDDEILASGNHVACRCGSRRFKQVNPTFWTIFCYIWYQPKYALKRIFSKDDNND